MITILLLLGAIALIIAEVFSTTRFKPLATVCLILAVVLVIGGAFIITITPSIYIPTAEEYAATASLYNECLETRDSEAIAVYNAQAAIINEGRENFYSWRWTQLPYILYDKFAEYPQLSIIIEGVH